MGRRKNSSQKQSIGSLIVVFLFLSIFFFVGLWFLFAMAIVPTWKQQQSKNWMSTTAVIKVVDIEVRRGDKSETYKPKIEYRYWVDDRPFIGSRLNFRTANYNARPELEFILSAYQVDAEVECFYNPDNPNEAVLRREASIGWMPIILPTIFMAIPLLFGWLVWLGSRTKRLAQPKSVAATPTIQQAMLSRSSEQIDAPNNPLTYSQVSNDEPFHSSCCPYETAEALEDKPHVMTSQSSRIGGFLTVLFIGLFWNGITYAVLFSVLFAKNFQLFPVLFLIPFELIGLVILGATGYYFLGLFNPKPTVVCSNTLLYPGSEFELSWTFAGRSGSVQKVSLNIIGIETVTYRQGTSTRTQTNEFYKKEVFASKDRAEINEGFTLTRFPNATMHTFYASKNKIQWFVEIVGEIKNWPDVREKFELIVYPPKVST